MGNSSVRHFYLDIMERSQDAFFGFFSGIQEEVEGFLKSTVVTHRLVCNYEVRGNVRAEGAMNSPAHEPSFLTSMERPNAFPK